MNAMCNSSNVSKIQHEEISKPPKKEILKKLKIHMKTSKCGTIYKYFTCEPSNYALMTSYLEAQMF
jgi:hypothetical protein